MISIINNFSYVPLYTPKNKSNYNPKNSKPANCFYKSVANQKNFSASNIEILNYIIMGLCAYGVTLLSLNRTKTNIQKYIIKQNLKSLKLTQLPKFIEFNEARTLKEARDFAKNVLKIKEIDKNFTLDALNFTNKGIVDVSNANKGSIFLPRKLKYKSRGRLCGATVTFDYKKLNFATLTINKDLFDHEILDKCICEWLYKDGKKAIKQNKLCDCIIKDQGIKFDPEVHKLIERYYKNPKSLTLSERRTLLYNLDEMSITNKSEYATLQMLKDIEHSMNSVLKQYNIKIDYSKLKKQNSEDRVKYVKKILKNLNKNKNLYIRNIEMQYPETIIYHEMGHLQDIFKNLKNLVKSGDINQIMERWRRIDNICSQELFENDIILIRNSYPKLYNYIRDSKKQEIAGIISRYAQDGIGEFIAEVYKEKIIAKIKGKYIPQEVDQLYKYYNGPELTV